MFWSTNTTSFSALHYQRRKWKRFANWDTDTLIKYSWNTRGRFGFGRKEVLNWLGQLTSLPIDAIGWKVFLLLSINDTIFYAKRGRISLSISLLLFPSFFLSFSFKRACNIDISAGISNVEELSTSQHVLCAWICGREAADMELCSDEEVVESITRVLRQFTGDPTLPYPANLLRSKWCMDQYFSGSYSYMGLESTVGHQCDLASPLPGTCFLLSFLSLSYK